jgi:hypothetical protein
MAEDALVSQFVEVMQCDRRIASFCLHRHHGDLTLAILYFLDNLGSIVVPPDFQMDEPSTADRRHQTESASRDPGGRTPVSRSSRGQRRPRGIAEFARSDDVLLLSTTKTKRPAAPFIPYGPPQFQPSPVTVSTVTDTRERAPENVRDFLRDDEVIIVSCIVWKNGITCDGVFFESDDPDCQEALRQIETNKLPTAIAPEIEDCDLDIEFNLDAYGP